MMTAPSKIAPINAPGTVFVPWNILKVDVYVIPSGQEKIAPVSLVSTIELILGVTEQKVYVCVAIS